MAPSCGHDLQLWAHRAEVARHAWGDSDEGACECQPISVCGQCNLQMLRAHGFLLLDSEALPKELALLN